MKLEIQSVKFKNFLSFGSKEQEVNFLEGTNIVLGKDINTGRSNGAGKSSFLETILFALYGKTHKNILKEQIINWKNRRNCEVSLNFALGQDSYLVKRAIKPDNFEIYENNSLIEKTSHVRDYQAILEEIFPVGYETCQSLIHSNINSSNRILSMKKPPKRKFIEDVFGLGIYSLIIKNANEKLRITNEKITSLNAKIQNNEVLIELCVKEIDDFNDKIRHLGSHELELKDVEIELEELKEDFDDQELDKLQNEINDKTDYQIKKDRLVTKINARVGLVSRWGKEVENQLKEAEASEKYKQQYRTYCANNGHPSEVLEKIERVKLNITKLGSEIDIRENEIKKILVEHTETKTNLANESKRLENLEKYNECPTCGTQLKQESFNIITDLEDKVKLWTEKYEGINAELNEKQKTHDDLFLIQEENREELLELEGKRETLYKLKDKIKSDYDKKALEKKKKRYMATYTILFDLGEKTSKEADQLDKDIRKLKLKRDDIVEHSEKIQRKEREIVSIKEKIKFKEQTKKEFEALIATKVDKIKNLKLSNKEFEKRKTTFINITDYLNFIKEICKDDNIKQYAISSIMPYLNQQTNFYLSEVGYGFYTILDRWLEAEIKGPGITKATYGSLSGGESRGIDLAIQFALLDIARVQAGIWPDILVIDEFLDTSVDSIGIGKLLELVKAKQMDDRSKIFIISHRDEIDNSLFDNTYFVEKKEFSEVTIL